MKTIRPQRITAAGFSPYGSVARLPASEPLAADEQFSFWSDVASFEVEGQTEIGYCTVRRRAQEHVGWMERHARTPELLVPADGSFLLPVMADGRIEVFRVEPGAAVVISPDVWHSACIPAEAKEVTYFVLFRRGTPREDVAKTEVEPVAVAL